MKLNTNIENSFLPGGIKSILWLSVYTIAVLIAIVLPVILWQLKLPFISSTFDGSVPGTLNTEPLELFGLFISMVLIAATWLTIINKEKKTLKVIAPIILPLLVSLQILFLLIETTHSKSSDYALCYENAAQAIIDGTNPYLVKCYLYPPLPAQALAFFYQVINRVLLFSPATSQKVWDIVFYFYQCSQFLLILLAYYLTYQISRRIGLRVIPATLIVSALFLFNDPLVRTIQFDQINVFLLNCFLLTILCLPGHLFSSGLAVALGVHLKLYTFCLLLPWTLTKQWRAVVGIVTGFFAILILQTGFGKNLVLWQNFLVYFSQRLEKPTNYRNNGIWSLIYNSCKIPARLWGESFFHIVPIVVAVINLFIVAWFIQRIIKREKAYVELVQATNSSKKSWNLIYRDYGHAIDSIALGLLISPSVWEHHYLLAIPVALWAIATRHLDQPWLVGIGTFLIFGLPTFDVFPLSHHRLLGLLILVYATGPNFVQPYFFRQKRRKRMGMG